MTSPAPKVLVLFVRAKDEAARSALNEAITTGTVNRRKLEVFRVEGDVPDAAKDKSCDFGVVIPSWMHAFGTEDALRRQQLIDAATPPQEYALPVRDTTSLTDRAQPAPPAIAAE